ncbi:fasciclin domain-containing protein [Sediminitomix flava]|uniref:Transforming growth factor-beta-induced protein n=1 Tax=Sediminitomix flava TaxID=379075 RepID=A0A315ZHJ0_SEDFL|nr:fasciclin domain-containing protein [Sediminitomix flava]PWJ44620.1 transforming growth factor-beta-induced protein [Sediminitomix flava]
MNNKFATATKWLVSIFLIGLSLGFTSCDEDENMSDMDTQPTSDIMEIVDQTSNVSTLLAAIDAASLRTTLKSSGPFTVFAPTNDAFAKVDAEIINYLLATPEELSKVLTYHVVAGKVMSTDLSSGTVPTVNEGQSLNVSLGSSVMINNATVTTADVEATNGVIHLINEVLLPSNLDLSGMKQTLAEIVVEDENFTVLEKILTMPEFSDILTAASNKDAELTIFAPTDAAFQTVLDVLGLDDLSEIPENVLMDIVTYHILGSVAMSSDLQSTMYETLNGESITVDLSSGVMIDNASVTKADMEASNGVLHVVDAVLLPSTYASAIGTIVEVPLFRKEYSMLTKALMKAELVETLKGEGPFTVFAPNNDAFEAAGITSLEEFTMEELEAVLLYHVVGAEVLSGNLPERMVTTLGGDFYLSKGDQVYINGSTMVTNVDIQKSNGVIHTIDQTLVPPSATVVDIAVALASATEDAEFTQLVGLLTAEGQAGVLEAISDEEGSFTIFAPTDAAFLEIEEVTSTLTTEQISDVLTYHVVPGRVYSTDLSDALEATTVNGQTLTVNFAGDGVTLSDQSGDSEDASVILVNINGTNGVIHVIDKVLIPSLEQ